MTDPSREIAYYRWRPHPWHGLETGPQPPHLVNAYIEITPFDLVKYEVDKSTGYLQVDRPQLTSSQPPMLYGFIPRTYCGNRVAALCAEAQQGDGDPLDIAVISERPISKADIILHANVVGGIQMLDGGEADDKIIAVLQKDAIWGEVTSLQDLPKALVERIEHYFSTYKMIPGQKSTTQIKRTYDREMAYAVVEAAMQDYSDEYGQFLEADKNAFPEKITGSKG